MTGGSSALLEVWQLTMFLLLDGAPEVCGNQNTLLRACSTELENMLYLLTPTREILLFYLTVCFLSRLTMCLYFSAKDDNR